MTADEKQENEAWDGDIRSFLTKAGSAGVTDNGQPRNEAWGYPAMAGTGVSGEGVSVVQYMVIPQIGLTRERLEMRPTRADD